MADLPSVSQIQQQRKHFIAAARTIMEELKANPDLDDDDDVRDVLSELSAQLSAMSLGATSKPRGIMEMKFQLHCAQETILRWISGRSMIWDSSPEITNEFLKSVREVLEVVDYSRTLSPQGNGSREKLLHDAESILHTAMERLEKEVVYILHRAAEPGLCSPIGEQNQAEDETFVSAEEDSSLSAMGSVSSGWELGQYVPTCLVHYDAVPMLKSIGDLMFAANYDTEFCEAFIGCRREALDECLIAQGVERFSSEDLTKMDWATMEATIKTWIPAIKTFVRVYLVAEKWLNDQILADHNSINLSFFVDSTKSSMAWLVMLGEAIALGPPKPERLFCLLDAYEALTSICSDVDSLFPDDAGSEIRQGFHNLIESFRAVARRTFLRLGDTFSSDPCKEPVPGGKIADVTRYVMNFIKNLPDHKHTLNSILQDQGDDALNRCLLSITEKLETNLQNKSELYKEHSLKHFFLMNNIHYMVSKVNDSELRHFFGDEWIKSQIKFYRRQALYYERSSWCLLIEILEVKDEGTPRSKSEMRERIKGFYLAFDKMCKSQREWCIRYPQLRKEVRISVCQKLLAAYRAFVQKFARSYLEGHIKYEAEDLEKSLEDLFEGSPLPTPRSLSNYWKR
ncbi:hypothetical protein Drorol1_Dr00004592 [Drosera rotundifolia]